MLVRATSVTFSAAGETSARLRPRSVKNMPRAEQQKTTKCDRTRQHSACITLLEEDNRSDIQRAGDTPQSTPRQSRCITASLITLSNRVTPVWRWQMVQQNNASHFSAAQQSLRAAAPHAKWRRSIFRHAHYSHKNISKGDLEQMGRFDSTGVF